MLRPNRSVSTAEAIEMLYKCNTGVLSMIDVDGRPYGVPINYYFDGGDGCIYFHCSKIGRKYEALKKNPNVSFVAVPQKQIIPDRFITHYESVLVEGVLSFIEEDQKMRTILKCLCDHLVPGELEKRPSVIDIYINAVAIGKIEIKEISGKRNVDY